MAKEKKERVLARFCGIQKMPGSKCCSTGIDIKMEIDQKPLLGILQT